MSLATIKEDIHQRLSNVEDDIQHILREHLPQLEQAAGSRIIAAIEATDLPADAEEIIASLIGKLGTPRGAESVPNGLGAGSDTPIADQAQEAVSAGVSFGGQAS